MMASSKRKLSGRASNGVASKKAKASGPQAVAPDVCRFHIEVIQSSTAKSKRKSNSTSAAATREETCGWPSETPIAYVVKPTRDWDDMKIYRNFQLAERKFGVGDFVLVNNGQVEKGDTAAEEKAFWPAKILEIRAADPSHVYARIYWLYWPEDLHCGRQHYHGDRELIASRHMDIVDVLTISEKVDVTHFLESSDGIPPSDSLYWRETYDHVGRRLSALEEGCACQDSFRTPGKPILRCGNPQCGKWSHANCVVRELQESLQEQERVPVNGSLTNDAESGASGSESATAPQKGKKPRAASQQKPSQGNHFDVSMVHEAEEEGSEKVTARVEILDTRSGERRTEELKCSFCSHALLVCA